MPLAITIALLTLREAIRRRLLLTVVILTPLVIGATGWGFSKFATLTASDGSPLPQSEITINVAVFVILIAFMFSVVLAVGAAFLAAPAIAADVDSALLLAILPRPIRRAELVVGKWLGLAAPLWIYTFVVASVEFKVIEVATGYVPPHPLAAVFYIAWQSLILLTFALALSTRLAPMASGIIVIVLFGAGWIVGLAQALGELFHNTAIVNAGTVVSLILPSDQLWRGAVYNLEPAILIVASQRLGPIGTTGAPTAAFHVWAVLWLLGILGAAVWSFGRRDL